jgi:RNA polymerase sigma-70 factor (ECF subfamily)
LTDEELMLAVRNGDVAKLGTLFERYHVALFGFLSRTTGDRTATEEIILCDGLIEAVRVGLLAR